MVALFEAAVVDRLGDDFGLVAVDATGGELLGETASGSNIRGAAYHAPATGRNSPCRLVDSGRLRGEADPA